MAELHTYIAWATFNHGKRLSSIPEGQFKIKAANANNLRKNIIAKIGWPKSVRGFWIDVWYENGRPLGTFYFKGYVPIGDETYTWSDPKRTSEYTIDVKTGKLVGLNHYSDEFKNRHLKKDKVYFKVKSAVYSNYKLNQHEYMDAFIGKDNKVYIGRNSKYDNKGNYDNTDGSLVYLSDNEDIYYLLYGSGWVVPQKEMFSAKTYAEFQRLRKGKLAKYIEVRVPTFAGVPFKAPTVRRI